MKTISRLRRLEETTLRLGGVGDNWHMTWADDDKSFWLVWTDFVLERRDSSLNRSALP